MHIVEVTHRYRNDFHFVAYCRHCQKKSQHGDGYADHFYQSVVFPHRHCEHCGMDEFGDTSAPPQSALADRQDDAGGGE